MDAPRPPLRLRLKPKAPPTGYVDGAWWPRSRELADELVALTDVLAIRLGPVARVAFDSAAWNPVADVDGRVIRLVALRPQEKHVLRVSGSDGRQLTLLVVPTEASDEAGHDAIMLAARRANSDGPADILAAAGVVPTAVQQNTRGVLRPRLRTRRPQR
ncbi:DUF5994 family protein [Actinokineospora inagensis]|uniref:DUF5994 family protein n=1 Tax=Actinokineospora inagensis TaxID=103730 RepID=UPI0012F9C517|nr:DUF5994 family protein [Actinokineospora inagensis]